MNTFVFGYEGSQEPTGTLYEHSTGASQPITVVEQPVGSGRYVIDFTGVAPGTYDVLVLEGGYLVLTETHVWDGTTLDPAAGATDPATAAAIAAIQFAITARGVQVTSPMLDAGHLELVAGDDYFAGETRAIPFAFTGVASLVGATVELELVAVADGDTVAYTGHVVDAAHVFFELAAANTAVLYVGPGAYDFSVRATLANTHTVTLCRGAVDVLAGAGE
jgi:hypothetical protein